MCDNRKDKIKVSAAIVSYNNIDKILVTIASILAQTKDVDLTLYISDNNSEDNTAGIIMEKFPQVTVLKNEKNGGFGFGHNKLLNIIDSKYHVIINPDIILKEDSISRLVEIMESDSSVVMATPRILNEDGTEQFLPKRNPQLKYLLGGRLEKLGERFKRLRAEYTMRDISYSSPFEIEFCTGCFFVIRTDVFKKIGGFDDKFFMYFEDADITRRAKQNGRVVFYPQVSVTHLWERASSKKLKYLIIQINSMMKYFKKWKKEKTK